MHLRLHRHAIWIIICWLLAVPSVAGAQTADWPTSLTIGTASPGGPYYEYGQAVAHIISQRLGIETNAQVTQGPAQNIVLLEKQEAMIGFVTTGIALQAWNGADWTKGDQYRSMRIIFPMYDTAFQFAVAKGRRISSLADFSGLKIGVGPRAGTGGTYAPAIFKLLNINAAVRYGAIGETSSQLTAGELDGIVFATGFPVPALSQLSAAQAIDLVEASAEEIATIRKQMRELSSSIVPTGTYSFQTRDYHTIGLYNFAVAHKNLSENFVFEVLKAVFSNRDELIKAQVSAKETIPANIVRNTQLPLHAGAIRYYRDIGVSLPPDVIGER